MDKKVLVVAGPSGTGKSTLIGRLMKDFPGRFGFSVSHTTRPPRGAEEEGIHYHFTSRENMEAMIKRGEFVEYALVHGNYYGTSAKSIEVVSSAGQFCLLDVDFQGVMSITAHGGFEPVNIFIRPPGFDVLIERLRKRMDTSEEAIARRMETTKKELKLLEENSELFHHVFVNDELEVAYKTFREFVVKELGLH